MRALAALFAKVPTPGRSKTRLAPLVGEHHASALARCFLQDTWSRLQGIEDLDLVLSCPDTDIDRFDLRPEPRCWGQGDGDLGARIEHTLRRGLERADVVLAIGADSPDLPATRIREAIEALERTEAVLIPAEDGGFVLLGLRICPDGLLHGLPWSSPHTCEATAQRLQQRGLRVTMMEPWPDVDRPADLRALSRRLSGRPQDAEHTARWLSQHPLPPTLGVVIPTLQEASCIERQLDLLLSMPGIDAIVVSDGHSSDGTAELARARGVSVVEGPAGRAQQMNRGAQAIDAQILWFIHADVRPPPGSPRLLRDVLCDHAVAAGAFRIRTVTDGGKRVLNSLLGVADLRSRHTRFPYGDQTLFMRREVFQQVGGFPELPVFEDVAMARRLRAEGALQTLDARVEVSGRRFMKQPVRTTLAWTLLPLLFRAGVPPSALAALYRPVR